MKPLKDYLNRYQVIIAQNNPIIPPDMQNNKAAGYQVPLFMSKLFETPEAKNIPTQTVETLSAANTATIPPNMVST